MKKTLKKLMAVCAVAALVVWQMPGTAWGDDSDILTYTHTVNTGMCGAAMTNAYSVNVRQHTVGIDYTEVFMANSEGDVTITGNSTDASVGTVTVRSADHLRLYANSDAGGTGDLAIGITPSGGANVNVLYADHEDATIQHEDDVFIKSDSNSVGAGNLYLQKGGSTLMMLDSAEIDMYQNLDMNSKTVSGVTTLNASGTITGGNLSTGGTLGVSGTSTLSGINNQSGNITNAGNISGAGTITASSTVTGGSFTTAGTLNSTGAATIGTGASTTNTFGAGATSNNTIGNAGTSTNTMTGATNTLTGTTSNTVSTTGGGSLGTTATALTAMSSGNGLTVNNSGAITLMNNTNSSGLEISADGNTVNLLNTVGAGGHGLEIDATSTVLSGGTNSSVWTLQDGNATLDVDTDQVFQATNNGTVTGVDIGSSVADSTVDINTADVAGMDTTIGSANAGAGDVTVQASTGNVMTVSTATTEIVGTAKIYASGTAGAGTGNRAIVDGTKASLESAAVNSKGSATNAVTIKDTDYTSADPLTGTGGNSITVDNTQKTTIADMDGNLNTLYYGTRVDGGMLIDGDLGVDGHIYTLDTTANAAVTVGNNGLDIIGATNTVTLRADADGLSTTARGEVALTPTTADVIVNTDSGVSHGLYVRQDQTKITGGTNSTSLTLDDSGATFRNDDTGGPARVTGVADGQSDFDAVNYRQLKEFQNTAYAGIASVAALSSIPSPTPGKKYTIGGGWGNFKGRNAAAVGGKAIVFENTTVTAGVGIDDQVNVTTSVGAGWSF
jgi:hypothetical protein